MGDVTGVPERPSRQLGSGGLCESTTTDNYGRGEPGSDRIYYKRTLVFIGRGVCDGSHVFKLGSLISAAPIEMKRGAAMSKKTIIVFVLATGIVAGALAGVSHHRAAIIGRAILQNLGTTTTTASGGGGLCKGRACCHYRSARRCTILASQNGEHEVISWSCSQFGEAQCGIGFFGG